MPAVEVQIDELGQGRAVVDAPVVSLHHVIAAGTGATIGVYPDGGPERALILVACPTRAGQAVTVSYEVAG